MFRKTRKGSIIKVWAYWPVAPKYPRKSHVKSVENIGGQDVILLEHDVPHSDFTDAVLSCLPSEGCNWQIPEEEFKSREDLRQITVCSVDPPGCTDIDDALHYRDLGGDLCEVGVHIADVSYFVKSDTAMDHEAANRGTTVYLTDKRIDMIPGLLSSNLCSLIEHQDRLAFSAVWRMRKSDAEVLDVKFSRSIIRSKASLTYEKAQEMIEDKSKNDALHAGLRGLNDLAKKLKARRLERGALVLARADEIRFIEVESETHDRDASLEIQHKKMVETNSMVEEFMLLANISVANKLLEVYPEFALLRRHPKPTRANLKDLIESAKLKGFDILPDDGKSLSDSLDKARLESDYYFNLMLRMIATRCMTPASYFCSGYYDPKVISFTHFGLAADLYTHFTSPIRRYADLLVHRLLASAIGAGQLDDNLRSKKNIQMMCEKINYRHRMAQLASRASSRLHTILYIKSKRELKEDAHVLYIRQDAIQILVPAIAFEYTYSVKLTDLDWHYDVDEKTQKHIPSNVTLRQFDKLQVHISVSSKDKIQVKILNPPIDDRQEDEAVKSGDTNDVIMVDDDQTNIIAYNEVKKKIRLDLDDKQVANPVIVVPGDSLDKYIPKVTAILGPGVMRINNIVVATKSGILKMRNNNLFWVDCHQKRYVAARGECVIGIVCSKGSLQVRVDINSSDLATLSLIAFEGANKKNKPNLSVGDLVYAKVLTASKHVETELVCVNSNGKKNGLGVIGDKGGMLLSLSLDTVRVLLSPQCKFLELLGQNYRYEIALGMNGRVWINSNEPATIIQVANELKKFDIG